MAGERSTVALAFAHGDSACDHDDGHSEARSESRVRGGDDLPVSGLHELPFGLEERTAHRSNLTR